MRSLYGLPPTDGIFLLPKRVLPISKADGTADHQGWLDQRDNIRLSLKDQKKIESRAEMISQKHKAATGMSHLRPDDAKRLDVLRHSVRLARIETEHHADELAAILHAEFPWMGPATEAVWHAMRRSVKAGDPGLRLPPLLLDGPPGIGKSAWARYLGNVIGVPTTGYEAVGAGQKMLASNPSVCRARSPVYLSKEAVRDQAA